MLIGHSAGAKFIYAAERPERLVTLVMVDMDHNAWDTLPHIAYHTKPIRGVESFLEVE